MAARSPFVGRATELEALRTLMPAAPGEGRRIVLLAGEAGAGKSRLAREFAAEAQAQGAQVLHGTCDAMVRTPHGPFAEALEQLIRATEPAQLREALGPGGGELSRLVPDLPALVSGLPAPVEADPDTERHRLHTAVAGLLAGAGRRTPVLLVLEDLHWADGPTLLLLRHLARSAEDARLLVLATFRDAEADTTEELGAALADMRRSDEVVRMRLEGLTDAEIADLVSAASGGDSDPDLSGLAATIHGLTGGNAFLVCELWRALAETGVIEVDGGRVRISGSLTEFGTPESVREVVGQRIGRLDPATTELLELAAVAGSEFELDLVRRAAGLDESELLAAFDQAVGSGTVEELSSQRLACRFTHEIVRRALYDRLSRGRRAELHLRVGEALESSAGSSGRELADLAHHFAAAAPLGGSERAVDYNLRAARAASAGLAFGEAVTHLRTAIEVGVEGAADRAEVLLELGTAAHRAAQATESLHAFAEAAEIARERNDAELLARAAVGYEEACWRPGLALPEAIELLEEALEAVGDDDPLRVNLLAGLGRALSFQGASERGALVHGNAVALARQREDRVSLAKVLVGSYWSRGATSLPEMLERITEARDLSEELGDVETRAEAMAWRVPTFAALSDLESARDEVGALRAVAEHTAQPFIHHVAEHYGSAIALCEGHLGEAERMAELSRDWAQAMTGRDAAGTYGIQMFGIRREQGRLAEVAPTVRVLARGAGREGPWHPGFVAVLAELGMEEEAKRELERIAGDGIDRFRESLWLATLTYLTDASAALGDDRLAATLYSELQPFAGTNVMIGHLVTCYGAADRYLGMLAATVGEAERAEGHFESALELNRRMGAPTWVAHTAYEYARLLLSLGRARSTEAAELLGEAASIAERSGMGGLLGRIRALGPAAPQSPALPDGLSPREVQILELVARGLSNREIGARLSISEHTAANHMRSILRKTECANRTEAASYAHRHGLTSA